MSQTNEPAAKLEMVGASLVAGYGVAGISFHDALEVGQLVVSIIATLLGAGYVAWKWHRDIRYGRRRDRRKEDRQ